jgi:DNA-directed RNA polymerase specialized sigma24 family protein
MSPGASRPVASRPLAELVESAWSDLHDLVRREIQARGRESDEAQVSSVLGDAMVRIFSQRETIVDASHLRGLTTLFTRRILIDRHRRDRRRRRALRDALRTGGGPHDPFATPDGAAGGLADALVSLRLHDERKFMAVTLAAMDRLPQETIADILDTSLATVERDLRFARAWIAARLGSVAGGIAR